MAGILKAASSIPCRKHNSLSLKDYITLCTNLQSYDLKISKQLELFENYSNRVVIEWEKEKSLLCLFSEH